MGLFDRMENVEYADVSIDQLDETIKRDKENKVKNKKDTIKRDKESARLIDHANKRGMIDRLLIDLDIRRVSSCKINLKTVLHVQKTFKSSRCHKNCDSYTVCERIISLSNKKGKSGSSPRKLEGAAIERDYSMVGQGFFCFKVDGNAYSIEIGKDWKEYKKNLASVLPREKALGIMRTGQYSGLQHRKSLEGKLFKTDNIPNS